MPRLNRFFLCSAPILLFCLGRQIFAAPSKPQATTAVSPADRTLAIGQEAPHFVLRDMDGTLRDSRSLRGRRNLLLTFFPKCFTFNCKNQLVSLRDSYGELQKADVEVWGVSVDLAEGKRGQKAFAKHLKLPYPLIPDPKRQICLLYATVQATNQMAARISVLIDKEGKVCWIDKQIDPRTHGADVLSKLRELQVNSSESSTP